MSAVSVGQCGSAGSGGREGAALGYAVEIYPVTRRHIRSRWQASASARWEQYGKRAGPLRNEEMIQSGADLVIAFAGGAGTADCVRRARRAGIPVREGP
jgi:hypothetical protein